MVHATEMHQRPEGTLSGGDPEPVAVRAIDLLPALAPAEDMHLAAERAQYDGTGLLDESTDFRARSEARDPIAALTVYAINGAILLFAFPVGFALLVFNILGGENLRTTAHVMGLTGLATALPYLGASVPFLT